MQHKGPATGTGRQNTNRTVYTRASSPPPAGGASAGTPAAGATPAGTPRGGHSAAKHRRGLTRRQSGMLIGALSGLLTLLVFLFALASCSGSPLPASSGTGGVSAPLSSESYDPASGELDETAFVGTVLPETDDAGMKYAEETLFLGDSNTNRMMYYADVTGVTLENCIGVDSMGITSFGTMACARFAGLGTLTMAKAVAVLQPKRVVVTFGTNNCGMDLDTFTGYYKDALDEIKDAWPHCDIIIGGIFPVDEYRQNTAITMKQIDAMNKALAQLAEQEDVKFLNWGEALRDEKTGYSKFEYTIQDGVHLTRKGMDAIFTYFRTHSYITEDRRPTPLKPIPERIGTSPGIVTADPPKASGPIDWDALAPSSTSATVDVVFSCWDQTNGTAGGGTLSGGGSSGSALTFSVAPGGTAPQVVATPAEGYEFAGWSCSVGRIADTSSPTLSAFEVLASVSGGEAVKVTASFRQLPASSSSSSSSVAPPSSSQPQASSQAPSSESTPSSASSIPGDESTSTGESAAEEIT